MDKKKCAHVWIEPKMPTGPRWAKTLFSSIFIKVFEFEENHHIFISAHLKYINSLIWRTNVHKVFGIEEKHPIFTSTQLKYKNFTYLDEKCARVNWAKNVDRSPEGENFSFSIFFFKSYFHFNNLNHN